MNEFRHKRHELDESTHTVALTQLAQLNGRLGDPERPAVTAGMLGVSGRTAEDEPIALPSGARLVRVFPEGSPDFPYVHGHFRVERGMPDVDEAALRSEDGDLLCELTPAMLQLVSHTLGLRHDWGS